MKLPPLTKRQKWHLAGITFFCIVSALLALAGYGVLGVISICLAGIGAATYR